MKGLFGLKITTGERKGSHRAEMLSETNRRPPLLSTTHFCRVGDPTFWEPSPQLELQHGAAPLSDGPALIITSNSKGFRGRMNTELKAEGRSVKFLSLAAVHICAQTLSLKV